MNDIKRRYQMYNRTLKFGDMDATEKQQTYNHIGRDGTRLFILGTP